MNILSLIGRKSELFKEDVNENNLHLQKIDDAKVFGVR